MKRFKHSNEVAITKTASTVFLVSASKTGPNRVTVDSLPFGWLVDPHQRIIPTANVPPQQLDWWTEEAVFGGGDKTTDRDTMPPEGIMSRSEAFEHRLKLMAERNRFHIDADESWHSEGYNFCEH